MLGKLMKYDFLAMSKVLIPIYLAMMIMTAILSITVKLNIESGILFTIFIFMYVTVINVSIFGTFYFIVRRFNKGLLKEEGYLAFSLPVRTGTHVAAKVINAVVWSFMEGLALLLSSLIGGSIVGGITDLINAVVDLFRLESKDIFIFLFQILLLIVLELIAVTCLIYMALAIAHLVKKYRVAVIILVLIVVSVLRFNLIMPIYAANSFSAYPMINLPYFLVPAISSILYASATWFILDRNLNLV